MKTKNMTDEKIYRNGDGYVFHPDPMREIPLAATVILQLMKRARDSEDLSDMELKMIRASALRILAEIEVIQKEVKR